MEACYASQGEADQSGERFDKQASPHAEHVIIVLRDPADDAEAVKHQEEYGDGRNGRSSDCSGADDQERDCGWNSAPHAGQGRVDAACLCR
jgi:hypothetical protein